jgi:23S rRNA pseudouridine1911/1915/1917 synthase
MLPSLLSFERQIRSSQFQRVRSVSFGRSKRASHDVRPSVLEPPSILYESNHLLAVHKPAGWHAVPNQNGSDIKCLLTFLKSEKLGGGSLSNFLIPLHRIDQPCTGIIIFGKTSKAASRIQSQWKQVRKTYLCVLDRDKTAKQLQSASTYVDDGWMEVIGLLRRKRTRHDDNENTSHSSVINKGWSVNMLPYRDSSTKFLDSDHRLCRLRWRPINDATLDCRYQLLLVETDQGARHMIRALLSQCGSGSWLAGDLRYGSATPLPDQSVALHARSLTLPPSIRLGSENDCMQRTFVSSIPKLWGNCFGVDDEKVNEWLEFFTTNQRLRNNAHAL